MTDQSLAPARDGITFEQQRDGGRLNAQHARVFDLMKDGCWRTLAMISLETRDPESSVSARLRDFRKERFGSHGVERRHMQDGLWEYRLVLNRKDLFE